MGLNKYGNRMDEKADAWTVGAFLFQLIGCSFLGIQGTSSENLNTRDTSKIQKQPARYTTLPIGAPKCDGRVIFSRSANNQSTSTT
jgi:hypothetical protein